MKFTKQSIADQVLPDGKSDAIFFDDDMPGFGLRLRAGGQRAWIVQYRKDGDTKRHTIGDARRVELEAARTAAKRLFAEVTLGGDPQAEKMEAKRRAALKLGAVADQYLEAKKATLRPSSHGMNTRYLTKHWKPLRDLPVHAIKRRDVAARLGEIIKENGTTAAARARSALSAFFVWAIGQGIADENPVTGTPDPDPQMQSRDRVLSADEIRVIWNACLDDDFGRITRLLMLTGARRDEIGGLRWQEIDFDKGTLNVPKTRTKNHHDLNLPLPAAALAILTTAPRREGRDFVFGGRGGAFCAWSYVTLTMGARIVGTQGRGLAPWRIHDIRRTVATGMAELGVQPHIIEAVLNHTGGHKAGVAGIYNRATYEREVRAALILWADHVRSVLEGSERKIIPIRDAS